MACAEYAWPTATVVEGLPLTVIPDVEVEFAEEVLLDTVSEPPPHPAIANTIPTVAPYRHRSAFPISYSRNLLGFFMSRACWGTQTLRQLVGNSLHSSAAILHKCSNYSGVTVPLLEPRA